MTKWEYKTVTFPAFKSSGLFAVPKLDMDVLNDTLRDYGNDGWELITQSFTADLSNGLSNVVLIFKRPKG